jgi:hypothetical protein
LPWAQQDECQHECQRDDDHPPIIAKKIHSAHHDH